jgi:hypothetical protein
MNCSAPPATPGAIRSRELELEQGGGSGVERATGPWRRAPARRRGGRFERAFWCGGLKTRSRRQIDAAHWHLVGRAAARPGGAAPAQRRPTTRSVWNTPACRRSGADCGALSAARPSTQRRVVCNFLLGAFQFLNHPQRSRNFRRWAAAIWRENGCGWGLLTSAQKLAPLFAAVGALGLPSARRGVSLSNVIPVSETNTLCWHGLSGAVSPRLVGGVWWVWAAGPGGGCLGFRHCTC